MDKSRLSVNLIKLLGLRGTDVDNPPLEILRQIL